MTRRILVTNLVAVALTSLGCDFVADFKNDRSSAAGADAGGKTNRGGASTNGGNAGAVAANGGATSSAGTTSTTTSTNGGAAGTGITPLTGGSAGSGTLPSQGGSTSGGTGSGGAANGGGTTLGGATSGGAANGGTSSGGTSQGGATGKGGGTTSGGTTATGGVANIGGSSGKGGSATGGVATGGVATGGVATGGTTVQTNPCSPNPCAHGTCTPAGSNYACACALNYFGPTCTSVRLEAINLPSASAVDADGNVVAGYSYQTGSSNTYAAQWTPSGALQILSSDSASTAKAVSGDGLTVFGLGGTDTVIYRWAGGTQYPMGLPLTGGNSALYASVNAANSDGTVMVGSARNPAGYNQAYRWSSGGGFDVFGPRDSFANGVSGDGSIVVGDAFVASANVPFTWSVATRSFTNLPLPSNYTSCYTSNISSDGLVPVGWCNASNNLPQIAVRWVSGSAYSLGALVSTDNNSTAKACNRNGSVVLGYGSDGWLWDALNGVRSLASILTAANADMGQWTSLRGDAISADGKTVVGYGTHAGSGTAFIARLP